MCCSFFYKEHGGHLSCMCVRLYVCACARACKYFVNNLSTVFIFECVCVWWCEPSVCTWLKQTSDVCSNKHLIGQYLSVCLSFCLFLLFKLQLVRCDFTQQYIHIRVCVCVCVCARARVYIYIIILQVEADHEKGDTGEGRRRETHSSKQRSNLRL